MGTRFYLSPACTTDPRLTHCALPTLAPLSRQPALINTAQVVPVMKKGGGWPYLLVLKISDGSLVWGKRVTTCSRHAHAIPHSACRLHLPGDGVVSDTPRLTVVLSFTLSEVAGLH